ncbi:SLBB domain-containing protein [Amycolatopsis cynarae]|uniref:SLBB domain-containing protein n=1 Tax=Amycolatopsis cynarae TaxID=2995223 RepID=A0ABY7AVT3_9PSEU|nr:NADH-ubiquinone oxidoreductase-F iron-sulfur binding region domain-containing protein [Amycolatopsis sp. HUAS 11-8]WAL64110.1 SLBB domain-containing protein [Amycolatopsis sp. HUAS 11-8]
MTAGMTGVAGLLDAAAGDLETHFRRCGPVPWGRPDLIGELRTAGLTGRGGGGFPVWRKLATVAQGRAPVVIANGAEGEPASHKDDTLLRRAPHLVLDGLQLAAETVRAGQAYLYTPPGPAMASVKAALAERAARRWDAIAVSLVATPDSFLSGEESAVVAAVEGRPARPGDRFELTARSGVDGRPTLVQNVETLAHLALIARYGPSWFRERGTEREPGTMLTTLSGSVREPGVYEVPIGTPLGHVLARAGGPARPLRALLVGGYHGTWIPATALASPFSRAGLGAVGAGVVVALDTGQCGLRAAAGVANYLAQQSARQCGPCLNGLPAIADAMARLAQGGTPDLPDRLRRLTALVEGRGACHHPDGTARFVRSALAVFDDEVGRHLRGDCVTRRTR